MPWTFWLSGAGLVIGAGMGLYAMINPRWASQLVRLREDQPGGAAEFRGTYGGLFLGAHAAALAFLIPFAQEIEDLGGIPTHWALMGALAACAMIWLGTSVGRVLSVTLDKTGGVFNYGSIAFELALGLAIAAPWIARFTQG
jgi:hypothetical protein